MPSLHDTSHPVCTVPPPGFCTRWLQLAADSHGTRRDETHKFIQTDAVDSLKFTVTEALAG